MNYSFLLTDTLSLILLVLSLALLVLLSIHYWVVFWRVGRYGMGRKGKKADHSQVADEQLPPLSVVIVAHNEADWLRENLVYLLEQDYPKEYEVVVVDYTSTDDTQFVLQVCSENYPNLKVVSMPNDVNMFRGKKFPLSMGIKSAKYDILVLTEPDCVPPSFDWLKSMARGYKDSSTKIVLGYCGIKEKRTLLNMLQRYENLEYSANYLARALKGTPETGCGRNLSYRRDFFYKKKSFTTMYTEEYGEDDLFVNQNGTGKNTRVVLDKDSWMMTDSKVRFYDWHLARKIRVSTMGWHSVNERVRRIVLPLAVVAFYVSCVLTLLHEIRLWPFVVGLLVVKMVWQMLAVHQSARRFEVKLVQWLAPLFEIYFIVANTILAITPLPRKKK